MATATDNFNRSEAPLSTGWSFDGGSINANGTVAIGTGSAGYAYYSGSSFSADQYSEITIGVYGNAAMGPTVRNVVGTGHYLLYLHSNDGWIIYKGGFTTVAQGIFTRALTTNDVIKITATGTSPTVFDLFLNGVSNASGLSSGSLSDASSPITTGRPGFFLDGSTATVNTWSGGDLAGAAAFPLSCLGTSYGITGFDMTPVPQLIQTWLRVSR